MAKFILTLCPCLFFFLLASRYLIFRLQDKYLSPVNIENIFKQDRVNVMIDNGFESIKLTDIKPGMMIESSQGDYIPVDSELLSEIAEIDNSILTGESEPVFYKKYETVHAGSKVVSSKIVIKATSSLQTSRVFELIQKINQNLMKESSVGQLADQGAQYLTVFIVLLAVLASFAFYIWGVSDGLERILALLVVSCPCALAIATPLAHSLTVKKAMKSGVLFKNSEAIESVSQADIFVFDKTGTLTSGQLEVKKWLPDEPNQDLKNIIGTIEDHSEHPVAKTLRRSLGQYETLKLDSIEEIPGFGMKAYYDNVEYQIVSGESKKEKEVLVLAGGKEVLKVYLQDQVKDKTLFVLKRLREKGKKILMFTGDQKRVAKPMGLIMGFTEEEIFYRLVT